METILNYLAILSVVIAITLYMYVVHLQDVRNDLKIKNDNLKTEIVKQKDKQKDKVFESVEETKKKEIKHEIVKINKRKKSDVNLSWGYHTIVIK